MNPKIIYERKIFSVKDIKLDPSNPNVLDKHEEIMLNNSLEKFGYIDEIVIDKNTMLVANGEHRLKQLMADGVDEIEVKVIDFKDEVERRMFRQIMNKAHGQHDILLDQVDYKWIYENDGFEEFKKLLAITDKAEVQFLASLKPITEDEIPVVESRSIVLGDVFQLGNHKVMCGNSTIKSDVERLMNGKKADMVFTDPPFNVGLEYIDYKDNKSDEQYLNFVESFYNNLEQNMKDGAVIYVMSGDKYLLELGVLFKKIFRFSQILLWIKDNPTIGNSDYQYNYEAILYGWNKKGTHKYYGKSVVSAANLVNRDTGIDKTIHKAQRPVKLVCDYINNSSKEGDIVLDLFGGSGSTLIAAEQTNRICYMMEIDPHYVEVICSRFEKLTGLKRVIL
jgi:DNA modification methylase